jgi:signal transduction histidine kinase
MKRVIRSGEPREFRSDASRSARTVADMFDSVIAWFTPERRARIIFPLEIALGVWLTIAILLNQRWGGAEYHAVGNILSAVALGAGFALHRVRPGIALLSVIPAALGTIGNWLTHRAMPEELGAVALAAIFFGSAAYGRAPIRWLGLVVSFVLVVILVPPILLSSREFISLDYLVVNGAALAILGLLPWVLGELVRSIRNRRQLSATVANVSTQRDAALTRADLEAERTRVARDVHDIVAHSLTVVIAQADGARYATAGDSPAAADAFETIAQTARDALADVRVLLTELRHTQEAGPQPGLDDLDALLAAMRDSGLALEVREFGDRGRLTETRELALYRIVQESLTNALRHGDGAAVVELEWGEQAVDLVMTNGASGAADETGERGHGIDGMRERASLAGGELSVHEGAVFRVRARLPLEPELAEVAA